MACKAAGCLFAHKAHPSGVERFARAARFYYPASARRRGFFLPRAAFPVASRHPAVFAKRFLSCRARLSLNDKSLAAKRRFFYPRWQGARASTRKKAAGREENKKSASLGVARRCGLEGKEQGAEGCCRANGKRAVMSLFAIILQRNGIGEEARRGRQAQAWVCSEAAYSMLSARLRERRLQRGTEHNSSA